MHVHVSKPVPRHPDKETTLATHSPKASKCHHVNSYGSMQRKQSKCKMRRIKKNTKITKSKATLCLS